MYKKARRFAVITDTHGNEQDDKAVAAMFDFMAAWKPEIRIHSGDAFDLKALRKGADEKDRHSPISDDIKAGCDLLKRYRPTHFLRGNHDERLWDLLDSDDKKLAEFGGSLIGKIKDAIGDAKMLPYDKRAGVLKIGHLKVIHGFHAGPQAARAAAQIYGSVLMGHIHSIDQFSIPGLERRIGRSIGCLCKLDMGYNRAHAATLRQQHGWAYGFIFPNGDYQVFQAENVGGAWHLPTEFRRICPR